MMNSLIKKEIRLVLPAWIVAVLLAMVQGFTRPYEFYVAWLVFFGLTIMALSSIGREASLNTFSSLLAQPAERIRIWQTKLAVLAVAFLIVLVVWLAAFGIAFWNSPGDESDRENSYNLFIAICLIATATFTGGLWTTLLLRQVVGSFWLTLLVPATLSGFAAVFLMNSDSNNLAIAVLSTVIGVYSIAGFFLARWLYFRAQDVGWSGGVIALPEWKFLSRTGAGEEIRARRPVFAILKKELRLQQGVLTGAVGVFVLHACALVVRRVHSFPEGSVGGGLLTIAWMPWQVFPALIGSIAIAEERKAGVIEGQLCLPVSRRLQFALKFFVALSLGILIGCVMPALMEGLGLSLGAGSLILTRTPNFKPIPFALFILGNLGFSLAAVLASFFASSLAKNFLQAIGLALLTFIAWSLGMSALMNGWVVHFGPNQEHSILPMIVSVPVIPVALVWLAYLNYKNFRDGWPLWRRNVLGVVGAMLSILVISHGLYCRAWEVFEPAEPAHGPAKFSLASPPELRNETYANLLVRLPDGRVWFDYLSNYFPWDRRSEWAAAWHYFIDPLPHSAGPAKFIAGSNWADASARHVDEEVNGAHGERDRVHITGYADTVGIQQNGTLWASGEIDQKSWESDRLVQVGSDTNWLKFVRSYRLASMYLLKRDGTLWLWGTNNFNFGVWPDQWPGMKSFAPSQIGTNSDWVDIYCLGVFFARKADGTVWMLAGRQKDGEEAVQKLRSDNPLNQILNDAHSQGGLNNFTAYVRPDGTLWLYGELHRNNSISESENVQCRHDTNWAAVANTWDWMVAMKKDGTLWQWRSIWGPNAPADYAGMAPTQLGIHHDWISLVVVEGGIVSLAADGSLWFWPDPYRYDYSELLTRLPKQPQFLGNVFDAAN